MKIYSILGVEIADVPVQSNAEHERELMKSNFIRLEWSQSSLLKLPCGTYIDYNGIKYRLLKDYKPEQQSTQQWDYSPEFQHPIMMLGTIPFILVTGDTTSWQSADKETEWNWTGMAINLIQEVFVPFLNKYGADNTDIGTGWTAVVDSDLKASETCTFQSMDFLSALSHAAQQFECEWHLDYENKILYFGHINITTSELVFEVGNNIDKPTIRENNEGYYNAYIAKGSTRNISQLNDKGENIQLNKRLTLNPEKYPDGYIDRRKSDKEPLVVKELIYDDIYPSLDLYIYNPRARTRFLLDSNTGDKVVDRYDEEGNPIYKKYSIWYVRLAYQINGEWKDFNFSKDMLIGNLSCQFQGNETSTKYTSPLAGREFELKYHESDYVIPADPVTEDTGIEIKKGDYEIVYDESNGLIIPTTVEGGMCPLGDKEPSEQNNILRLYNIALPSEYVSKAQEELEKQALEDISYWESDRNNYEFNSNPVAFKADMPELFIGRGVVYKNGEYELKTRISKLVQKIDFPYEVEITVGNEEIKGNTTTMREQLQMVVSAMNNGMGGMSVEQFKKMLNIYASQIFDGRFLSKLNPDTAAGIITFLRGVRFANTLLTDIVKSDDWHKIMDDTQLVTGGGMEKYVEYVISLIADKYLRRDIDDEAKGLITFLAGLKSDDLATFLSGIKVAGLAVFKNTLSSETFVSGWSGYGWRLLMKGVMNVIGSTVMKSELEVDELTVRGSLRAFEFIINQLRGENDNFVFAGMQKVQSVDADNKTIYLDTNKGETYCPFTEGDILRCQRFQTGGTIIKQYDIVVKEAHVGSLSDGENRIDSIVWEAFSGEINDIAQGDVLCRLDNDRDPERKGIITTTSVGSNSPCIDVIYGLITNPKESLKVRLGKLDGIVNELLGELSGYGLYSNNAFLTGEFYLSTGEAVSTKIKMLENLFSSSMSKTTYDIKEDDNIVTNCAFIDDMRGWNVVDGDDMDLFFIDDDTPVFMNDDMFSDGHSVASLENVQGKNMLHLLNAGVTQDNTLFVGRVPADSEVEEYVRDSEGNIIKNDDGTLQTKTKTIRPTIYISYRYMCKESGSLSIGFNNGRTTQYSSDMGVIVSVDELGTLSENVNANDGVWIERQYKGYYDKSGDFVISTTGEVYIDVLAVTSKPLNDFKNVVSTALVQTAGAIGLYGRNIKAAYDNIGGLTTSITELGVRVDAEEERVDIFVNKTYPAKMTEIDNRLTVNEEGISLTAKTVEANVTRIGQLEVTSGKISAYVAKTRTAGAELVYNNTVTIRTDENNKTATILDYIITPTFLIANVAQTITNIQIASGSDTGNPHLVVMTEPFAVKVVCDKGVAFTEPVLLEAVVSVARKEEDVYGEMQTQTYQRSMFITVYPSTKGETGYGFVATVSRNNTFTEAQWNDTYGATGHTDTWSNTSAIRNGCRVGDIFLVTGYASDTLNMHSAFYRSTTASGNLAGTCISHSVVARGQKGDTGAGEVWQLIDNGCYASVTAEEKLTLYLAYVVVYTIDGTSVSNSNYKVYWKANNKTTWNAASNGVMLNAVDFNKDATYQETESFVVRLESNGVAVGTITVPVKLAPGAAQIITDNMIKSNVFGSDEWSSVKQTANAVSTEVANAKGSSATLKVALDEIKSTVSDVDGRLTSITQTVEEIDLSVYAKTADVNGQINNINSTLSLKANSADLSVYATTESVDDKTGAITTSLKGMGINIDTEKITISGTGNFIVDTTNFKLDESGNVDITGKIIATSGTFDNCTINETCKAGFMKYAVNKLNGTTINCGFINLGSLDTNTTGYEINLPSVAEDEFLRVTIMYPVATRVYTKDFTIGINSNGKFHDFTNFPIGGSQPYGATIRMERGVYYEFVGMYASGYTRWICVNKDLPRI